MKKYYWESERRNGSFLATNDEEAIQKALQDDKLLCVYYESDTSDGLPFIVVFDHKSNK